VETSSQYNILVGKANAKLLLVRLWRKYH